MKLAWQQIIVKRKRHLISSLGKGRRVLLLFLFLLFQVVYFVLIRTLAMRATLLTDFKRTV